MSGNDRSTTGLRHLGVLLVVLALLTAVTSCGTRPGTAGPGPSDSPRPVRYMPVGDSITDGYTIPGGYRTLLWQLLVQQEGDRIDFVGSKSSGPEVLGDKDNEGHGGWCIDGRCGGDVDKVVAPRIEGWVTQYRPDIVSVHLGTNDIKKGADGAETARRLDDLVGRIYAADPGVYVIVCQIIPARMDVEQHDVYAAAIPAIAARYQAQGRRLAVVDLSHALTVPFDYTDGTHPNQGGYDRMARALYPAVSEAYRVVERSGATRG